jgi:sarcosine oxidase, subunit beta
VVLAPRRIGVARAEVGGAAHELPIGIDDLAGSYFRPLPGGELLFGVETAPGGVTAADEPEPVRLAEARVAASRLAEHIPALRTAPLTGSRVGVDAYTPDRQPLIGPFGPDGLYLCTGFSGGGIKSAPAVGVLVARELADGEPAAALAPFRPARLTTGQLIESDYPYEHS